MSLCSYSLYLFNHFSIESKEKVSEFRNVYLGKVKFLNRLRQWLNVPRHPWPNRNNPICAASPKEGKASTVAVEAIFAAKFADESETLLFQF